MHLRIINAKHIFIQLKRFFHICCQFAYDFKIEVKNIAAPVSVTAAHAIRPASIHCQLFSVIQKIIRQFVHYANKISEKDQSGKCRM